jgi:hypothetical protein
MTLKAKTGGIRILNKPTSAPDFWTFRHPKFRTRGQSAFPVVLRRLWV